MVRKSMRRSVFLRHLTPCFWQPTLQITSSSLGFLSVRLTMLWVLWLAVVKSYKFLCLNCPIRMLNPSVRKLVRNGGRSLICPGHFPSVKNRACQDPTKFLDGLHFGKEFSTLENQACPVSGYFPNRAASDRISPLGQNMDDRGREPKRG